jgi:hypothetical protein
VPEPDVRTAILGPLVVPWLANLRTAQMETVPLVPTYPQFSRLLQGLGAPLSFRLLPAIKLMHSKINLFWQTRQTCKR